MGRQLEAVRVRARRMAIVFALALASLLLLCLGAQSKAEAKIVVGAFGPAGAQGGQFGGLIKVAINNSGAGGVPAGTLYVADSANNRIQRLSPAGGFERAWGFDVDASNPSTGFEICTVATDCKSGTVAAATANGGQLSGPQGIDVDQTTGHVYAVESLGRRVSEFDADGNFIRTWGADVLVGGITTFEICAIAAECKNATAAGTDGGQLGESSRALQIDPAGNVWVADTANRRLQKFDAAGNFIAVYGYGVNGGATLESCTSSAAGICKASPAGNGVGQIGNPFSPFSFAFDAAGNLYVNDAGNGRIIKFNPAMTTATTFATVSALDNIGGVIVLPGGNVLVVTNQSGERQVVELDSAGLPVETSLTGIGLTAITSFARNTASGRIYLTTINHPQANVLMLEDGTDPPPPPMTVDPITTKTATTASFSGTLDPQGATISSCSFQYSTSESFAGGTSAVPVSGCSSLAPGGGAQAVTAGATGLQPNTQYFVRLAVNRLFVPGTSVSAAQSFATDAAAPVVSNVGAVDLGDTSARFVATVDPRNSGGVEYVFEYGTTPALGSQTDPVQLDSGPGPVVVSQVVPGLSPATQYYLRVTAANTTGSAQSATVTFTTRANPLPGLSSRVYEMVSPPDKNGGAALSGYHNAIVAPDGEAIGFCTTSLFGDPPGPQSETCADYVSRRGTSGWQTKTILPAYCRVDLNADDPADNAFANRRLIAAFSSSLDWATVSLPEGGSCTLPPLDPAAPLPQRNFYRKNLLTPSPTYELLAPAAGISGRYAGSSKDFSHIVYTSPSQQTGDAPAGSFAKVFEWDNGTLRLVSRGTTGAALIDSSSVPSPEDNGVSDSGDRIFFQNQTTGSNEELYLREGAEDTYHVSQSECTVSCGSSNSLDVFRFATPSGDKTFFTSNGKLTNSDTSPSGVDLYMYVQPADPDSNPPATEPNNLTLLSPDAEPADGVNADVLDVLGISDDGESVYFVANGQLVAGKSTAFGPKIYRWQWNGGTPILEYLASVVPTDAEQNWTTPSSNVKGEARLVTPDGNYLLFGTTVALDPVADGDSDRDAYRWDDTGGWICVSCQAPGSPSAGDVSFSYRTHKTVDTAHSERRIAMTDDGQRIFFSTPDALVPTDTNGEDGCPNLVDVIGVPPALTCADVYEWHDGTVGLITTGTGDLGAQTIFLGASADGRDVFVYTNQRLVGWDTDDAGDIYDARIGGGLPEPPSTGTPCEGDACRGSAVNPPATTGAGSAVFLGPGNPVARKPKKPVRCGPGKRKVTKNGKARCVKKSGKRRRGGKRDTNGNRRTAR
jgi:hypothetical protein